ncbi:MAG: S8 family serine peptidase [Gammaproteobacteria bacterium]|nr:S8 family serine peptidase [Gammaproteobacteria bacterium]
MRKASTLLVTLVGCVVGMPALADTTPSQRREIAPRYDQLKLRAQQRRGIPVLVRFKVVEPDGRSLAARKAAGRLRLNNAMASENIRAFAEYPRSGLSAFFVDAAQLDKLIDSGFAARVRESKLSRPYLQESNLLIRTSAARAFGLEGSGAVVVVLDTGIDADHPTFDDRVVWEACFSTNWSFYGATNLCPLGGTADATQYRQKGPGAAALTKCTDVPCWHGTHVASIAAGSSATYPGIAPAAGVIPIQVFSRFDDEYDCGVGRAPCVLSFQHDQIAALEYVAELAATYNIAAVNMSLGGGSFSSACDALEDLYVPAIDDLESLDIIVAAASGNGYLSSSIGSPACLSKIVSVGSVDDTTDLVSAFSNGAAILDLLAPGAPITAAYPGSGYATASGTSMATPQAAGAIALMKGFDTALTYAQMKSLLVTTGTPVLDSRNGLTFPRVNLARLALAVTGAVPGDANGDGEANIADLLLFQRHVIGDFVLSPTGVLRSDLHPEQDPDGTLDASDLVLLEQALQGD